MAATAVWAARPQMELSELQVPAALVALVAMVAMAAMAVRAAMAVMRRDCLVWVYAIPGKAVLAVKAAPEVLGALVGPAATVRVEPLARMVPVVALALTAQRGRVATRACRASDVTDPTMTDGPTCINTTKARR